MKKLNFTSPERLHEKLFEEEYIHMYDSSADAKDRAEGINPTNKEYQEKIRKKRGLLGVSQLSASGSAIDDSSMKLCERLVAAAKQGKEIEQTPIAIQILQEIDEYKEKLMEEQEARAKPIENIDPEDPNTWTEAMINNSYNLMVAADHYDMDPSISFEEFKRKIFSDKYFARNNAPRGFMGDEDYNPYA